MKETEKNIKLLPPELANQIAAGEVVERPSSVLKELTENSLDAQATSISAIIEDGGQAYIRVSDNGRGIPKEELSLAVTRHATSKIQTVSDLSAINSFGFRGEALPSIASVSRFKIISNYFDDPEKQAYALDVTFGEHSTVYPATLAEGTQIEVHDLFNNIPARLKFLKSPSTELKKAQEIFTRMALIRTGTAFHLHAGTREIVSMLADDSIFSRLCRIWSSHITSSMEEMKTEYDGIKIFGYISNPRSTQPKADRLLFYVNNRPVNDKVLFKAVRQAYQKSITSRDFPQVLLCVTIPPEEVDVNVHPAKSEVRFRDEQRVFRAVYTSIENTLDKLSYFNHAIQAQQQSFEKNELPIDSPLYPMPEEFENKNNENPLKVFPKQPIFKEESILFDTVNSQTKKPKGYWGEADKYALINKEEGLRSKNTFTFQSKQLPLKSSSVTQEEKSLLPFSRPQYLGQAASSYLLFKQDNGNLLVLDQHAVHERILYERYSHKKTHLTQTLLSSIDIQLHISEVEHLKRIRQELELLGFSFLFDENSILLTLLSIPTEFDIQSAKDFIQSALVANDVDMSKLWISHACDVALKANQNITHAEAEDLFSQWTTCVEPDFCPHGRPCYVIVTKQYWEKLFKRS